MPTAPSRCVEPNQMLFFCFLFVSRSGDCTLPIVRVGEQRLLPPIDDRMQVKHSRGANFVALEEAIDLRTGEQQDLHCSQCLFEGLPHSSDVR